MTSTTNPNVADYHGSGRTPEYVASLRGHNDIVKLFRNRARLQREKEKEMPLCNEERSGWTWVGSGRFRRQN